MKNIPIKGVYCDVLKNSHGDTIKKTTWRSNAIVSRCDFLLAALLKGEAGLGGIQYWAVGNGLDTWDGDPPSPSIDTTQLVSEVKRLDVSSSIIYLQKDPENQGEYIASPDPTNILEIKVEIDGADPAFSGSARSLREFGLIGGEAAGSPSREYLIDYVIHPRIDLTDNDTLTRRLRLTFDTATNNSSAATRSQCIVARSNNNITTSTIGQTGMASSTFISNLSVRSIDGIGSRFSQALDTHGIKTVSDLAAFDTRTTALSIPAGKLREFRTKAKLLLRSQSQLDPLALQLFKNQNLYDFLNENPNHLALGANESLESVEVLQDALVDIQITLDDSQLRSIRLGDLLR